MGYEGVNMCKMLIFVLAQTVLWSIVDAIINVSATCFSSHVRLSTHWVITVML